MRFLIATLALTCLARACPAAEPPAVLPSAEPPAYIGKALAEHDRQIAELKREVAELKAAFAAKPTAAPCVCGDACKCPAGDCPAKCPTGTLRTASGRLIRATASGYAYADDEPGMVLDCSSGKCKWVDAVGRIQSWPPTSAYSPDGCASGQCGTSSGRAASRFAFPRK